MYRCLSLTFIHLTNLSYSPTAGQVASLTSSNNFINFCLTVPNLPISNGLQVKTGSCNPAPMGVIAATTNMPSGKFQFPPNFGTVKANTAFTIKMAISHLETGNFVNAQESYFAAPQQINGAGDIKGHSHVLMDQIDSFQQTTPTNPNVFAFFKGLNNPAQGGVLTADVTNGLPAGFYRLASINAAANHQPVLVAIAQHGSLDDMVYVGSLCPHLCPEFYSTHSLASYSSLSPPMEMLPVLVLAQVPEPVLAVTQPPLRPPPPRLLLLPLKLPLLPQLPRPLAMEATRTTAERAKDEESGGSSKSIVNPRRKSD